MPETVLRFGIPSLDELLAHDKPGGIGVPADTITLAIEGTDGTGKSVLALHLASCFAASHQMTDAKDPFCEAPVVYAATDLSHERAKTNWENFFLHHPKSRRRDPFTPTEGTENMCEPVDLAKFDPLTRSLVTSSTNPKTRIDFLDLGATSTGDEWATIDRVVAARPPGPLPFMLIIDTVEGLETWVGEKDAFGAERSRRSRIAQLLRTARGKCHVVLVVEESQQGQKAPEEFVADVVIHVRYRADRDYSRRTIEVEKVRGQTHVRGQHDFAIRSGRGSFTGRMENPDDPEITLSSTGCRPQSYFYVFHSMHYQSRAYMEQPPAEAAASQLPPPTYASFGIPYLDNMLGRRPQQRQVTTKLPLTPASVPPIHQGTSIGLDGDDSGLPTDAATALIGEDGTFKSVLGRAFLSRCFAEPSRSGVAVLVTTKGVDRDYLKKRFEWHLLPKSCAIPVDSILCRRLELHHLSSSVLMHIIVRTIQHAQIRLFDHNANLLTDVLGSTEGARISGLTQEEERLIAMKEILRPRYRLHRRQHGWRIRLVIDNWSTIEDTYPEIKEDPLFLPFLLFYLQREGIASLIIATETGGATQILQPEQPSKLRRLTPHHLFTWHVPFFGEHRVAITAIPPIGADRLVIIRELKTRALTRSAQRLRQLRKNAQEQQQAQLEEGERLLVSPELELYSGLERGAPRPIPLRVHLYLETKAFEAYANEMNSLLSRLTYGKEGMKVITGEDEQGYEQLREFSHLQSGTRLGYTLVFQVDEFWAESSIQLCDQYDYLWAKTVREDETANVVEDPFRMYQPSLSVEEKKDSTSFNSKSTRRHHFFNPVSHSYEAYLESNYTIDKVPFYWDFGFLLCRERAWEDACSGKHGDVVKNVLGGLKTQEGRQHISWDEFFDACKIVARRFSKGKKAEALPFDVSMIATESFSCLVLEIWASKIAEDMGCNAKDTVEKLFPRYRHEKAETTLIKLLEDYWGHLCDTWKTLAKVMDPGQFPADYNNFKSRSASPMAVAARHWYSTATNASQQAPPDDIWIPLRLPGRYSVRGDWFLAIADGSRSRRLGERALDILCSRRANIVRLQMGIGLPVRETGYDNLGELWTPLMQNEAELENMTYDRLKLLGAASNPVEGQDFRWLWRSQIKQYDRHARIWQRWLCSILTRKFDLFSQGANKADCNLQAEKEGLIARLKRATLLKDPLPQTGQFADA